jgi:uncharacterized protein YecE (DUF72 family)
VSERACAGRIRVGVGGFTFAPWRGTFYPRELPQSRELEYASRRLSAIEINATFYRTQSRASFTRWRTETPDDFVFTLKAPRYATHRTALAQAQPAIERFLESGITELGAKLGALLWSFAPAKRFEPEDFAAFLALLPDGHEGLRLRHALDVRHASFASPQFVALARRHRVAIAFTDSEGTPSFADTTADFVYARLKRTRAEIDTGYSAEEIARWARIARAWADGDEPPGLPRVDSGHEERTFARDVFVFFIAGAKERAPAAACALLKRLKESA